jgi:hypothetical protein
MTSLPVTAAEPSPIDAAVQAYEHTRRHLFPFKFERWLALGLVAFLDQCGRGGISGSVPGGGGRGPVLPTGNGAGSASDGGLGEVGAWVGAHVALVVGLAALAIALIVAFTALVLWINSRATFIYVENVATGGTEIARPWRAHAERAWSYFAWRFGLALGLMVAVLSVVGLGVGAFFTLRNEGYKLVVALLVLVPLLLLLIVAAALLSVALRDFAAPIQMAAGVGCTAALRRVADLVRAHPLAFFLYVVLKVVFGIAQGIVLLAAACVTCCCILIPVVTQTFLQPLFYFERAWPLYLLRQMGYDLVTAPAASVPTVPAPVSPTGGAA